jgi:hypothetical protein
MGLDWTNNASFLKTVDQVERSGAWSLKTYNIEGDLDPEGQPTVQTVDLWMRNPLDLIRELIGNPDFKDVMHYAPERHYMDNERENREYNEAWTADWWWNTQVQIIILFKY